MMLELGGGANTAQNAATAGDLIKDGSDATFMADVVEASLTTPVIVDFWAPWCGPCRQLGPALEQAVQKAGGKVRMVKINIDENPAIAGQLRVQSIPAVFAFADGQPVDGFQGALPPGQLQQFVDKLAAQGAGGGEAGEGPGAEQLEAALDAADAALTEGAVGEAAQIFAQVLGVDAANLRAIAGLSRCYIKNGDFERARETLGYAPEDQADAPEIAQARSALALAEDARKSAGKLAGLQEAVAQNPDDHQSRFDLAVAMMGTGDSEGAVDGLLELFRRDREWNEDAARQKLFEIFDALGPKDPLTLKGRRKLSSMIFA